MKSESGNKQFVILGVIVFVVGFSLAWLFKPAEQPQQPETTVFAAASLRDVIYEVGSAFQMSSKSRIHFNLAGSNVLAQQIVAAPQADLYISANEQWMDYVEKAGRIVPGSRKTILSNKLVIVAHESTDWEIKGPKDFADVPFTHLSLANPDAVPAGKYAKAYMQRAAVNGKTLWDLVAARVAPAMDVRSALAMVAADPSILGIVYRTDATVSKRVRILYEIPEGEVPPVRYLVARIQRPDAPPEAEEFFEFLFSERARQIFSEHGFIPVLGSRTTK